MRKLQRMTFLRSVIAVLAGNAISLWMPNRAGDYIGRAVLLRPRSRVRGVLATLIGGIAQLMITLVLGMLGAVYYAHEHWGGGAYLFAVLWVLTIAFTVLLLVPYFNLNKIRFIIGRQGWQHKLRRYLSIYSIYSRQDLAAVLCLSLIRYLVFSIQLFLLLLFFAVPVEPLAALPSIFLIFLVQTVVPTTALSELAVRGAASVTFLAVSDQFSGAVLAASYSIWLLNIRLRKHQS
jgi:hypothetical protein